MKIVITTDPTDINKSIIKYIIKIYCYKLYANEFVSIDTKNKFLEDCNLWKLLHKEVGNLNRVVLTTIKVNETVVPNISTQKLRPTWFISEVYQTLKG